MRGQWALVAACCLQAAGPPQVASAQTECGPARVNSPPVRSDAERVVQIPARLPCRLVVRPLGTTLRTDAAGTIEGIGPSAVRLPDGGYATAWRERIQIWSANGRPVRQFGRRGSGPGEFSAGSKQLFVRHDTLLVRDGILVHALRVDATFLGTHKLTVPVNDAEAVLLLPDGRLLTSGSAGRTSRAQFHLSPLRFHSGAADRPTLAFGTLDTTRGASPVRMLAHAGGSTFWAASAAGTTTGSYTLEHWDVNGTRLARLRRPAAWFRGGASRGGDGVARPAPAIGALHADSAGHLFVVISGPRAQWDPRAPIEEALEVRVDVIRTADATLIASWGPVPYAEALATLPQTFFPGSRRGMRLEEDAEGLQLARVVEWRLESSR